jgi:hypothetical protein
MSQSDWTDPLELFELIVSIVGELGKTLTPSKCRIVEIHETGSRKG